MTELAFSISKSESKRGRSTFIGRGQVKPAIECSVWSRKECVPEPDSCSQGPRLCERFDAVLSLIER